MLNEIAAILVLKSKKSEKSEREHEVHIRVSDDEKEI
jgi:hypothetical protein